MSLEGDDSLTARAGAMSVLLEWDRSKWRFVEELVHEHFGAHDLSSSDRRFLMELCYGVVRRRNTLRHISELLCHHPLAGYHRTLRVALTLGLYQAIYLGTPAHAVVDTSITAWHDLMRGQWRGQRLEEGRGFLNAVLRRACDSVTHHDLESRDPHDPECVRVADGWARVPGLGLPSWHEHRARHLGIKYSHPPEMVRVWLERFDEETLIGILVTDNTPPPIFLVLRRGTNAALYRRKLELAGISVAAAEDPQLLRLENPGAVELLPGYDGGEFWVQDATARRLALLMPERPGSALLDLCAAPGGKLATLLDRGDPGSVLACDIGDRKLRLLARNLERLRFDVSRVEVLEVPRESDHVRIDRRFDQILVDAPCSNTGVLARRHEARWRFVPETLRVLERTQFGLLRCATRHLAPGGDLLYTTCSLEPLENANVAHTVLRSTGDLQLVTEVEVLPGPDGDGGYGALFRRRR